MIVAVLAAMVVVFAELFLALGLRGHFRVTTDASREVMAILRSETMSDDDKETAMRRLSLQLIRQSGLFLAKLALILAAMAGLYLIAIHLLGVDAARLDASLLSPLVWLAMTIAAVHYVWIRHALARRL